MSHPVEDSVIVNAPAEKVWTALTDAQAMRAWYFEVDDFSAEPQFAFSFEGRSGDTSYLHLCTVQEVVALEKISYTWRYKGHEGSSLVTFLLQPFVPQATKVTVRHEGLESFGNTNPHLSPTNFATGWKYLLHTALKSYVEKPWIGSST